MSEVHVPLYRFKSHGTATAKCSPTPCRNSDTTCNGSNFHALKLWLPPLKAEVVLFEYQKVSTPDSFKRGGWAFNDPCWGMAWADTDNFVYQIEINRNKINERIETLDGSDPRVRALCQRRIRLPTQWTV